MQNSWKPGICIPYGYKQSVMSYTDYAMTPCIQKVFIATYIYDRQCIIIILIHTYVVYDLRRTLFDFWEQR